MKAYDYVFYDCPPNVYAVTKNALYAADFCVVPFVPDFLSLSGFQILAQQVEQFSDRVSGFRQGRRRSSITAIAVSHYREINAFRQGVEELRNTLAQLKAQHQVLPSCEVLEPFVRLSADVAASTGEHLPVCLHAPDSIGSADYYQLAQALEAHLEQL
ncbi:MAG: ParA family protein [Methylacidiphilales bacterium]|nr:ParA family protein [Candidatus Methylacidiphilales bacterium]